MRLLLVFFVLLFNISFSQTDTIIFSHNSGIYTNSIELKLTNNSGNKIYFSLNGDYPKTEYSTPILIDKTVTLRVKNEKKLQGYTRNYIFQTHTLPVVCLTINPSDLYDSTSGIYVKGYNASPNPPYLGANFHKGWEKQAYIEMIDTNGFSRFNQKVGVKIFGQFSAMLPQKSFAVYARSRYGNKRIKNQLFTDLPFKKYKSIILRNSGSDFCNSHFRDAFITNLVKHMNFEKQAYRSCVVYLNGNYWGVYHIREKINERFLQQHTGIDKDSLAILKYRGATQHYGRMNYKKMLSFISKTNFKENKNIDSLDKLMDIDNYLEYNIAQVFINNIDAGGNIRFWRPIKKGGKWRWILFDTDFGFGLKAGNRQEQNTVSNYFVKSNRGWPYPNWSTLIIRKLIENDSIKELYLKKFSHHLNTTFSSKNTLNHINKFERLLEPEIEKHFKKWKRSSNIWNTHLELMRDFAMQRPLIIRNQLIQHFEIDSFYTIKSDPVKNGKFLIENNFITPEDSPHYFSNILYKFLAKPNFGYKFSHWKEEIPIQQNPLMVSFESDLTITPIFIQNDKSIFTGKVFLNEICRKDTNIGDYIELHNTSNKDINISGWVLSNIDGENYQITDSNITANGFITIYRGKTKSKNRLFNIQKIDHISLFSSSEELVDEIETTKDTYNNLPVIERVNTLIKKGWIGNKAGTPGTINSNQIKYSNQNKYIAISFFVLLGILFLSIFLYRIKKRPRGATE